MAASVQSRAIQNVMVGFTAKAWRPPASLPHAGLFPTSPLRVAPASRATLQGSARCRHVRRVGDSFPRGGPNGRWWWSGKRLKNARNATPRRTYRSDHSRCLFQPSESIAIVTVLSAPGQHDGHKFLYGDCSGTTSASGIGRRWRVWSRSPVGAEAKNSSTVDARGRARMLLTRRAITIRRAQVEREAPRR